MQVFDLKKMQTSDQKEKNVFFQTPEFKARIIDLPPEGEIAPCEMVSYVLFYVIEGSAKITADGKEMAVSEDKCLITEPTSISMKSKSGGRIMGVQITKRHRREK